MNVDSIEGMKEQCMSRRKYSTFIFLFADTLYVCVKTWICGE